MFNMKTVAAVLCWLPLAGCVTQQQFAEHNAQLAVALGQIPLTQAQTLKQQAHGNATLAMIHGTPRESLALQHQQAVGSSREAYP